LQLLTGNHEQAYASYQSLLQAGMDEPEFRLQIGQLFSKSRRLPMQRPFARIFSPLIRRGKSLISEWRPLPSCARIQLLRSALYRQRLQQNPHFEDAEAELRIAAGKTAKLAAGQRKFIAIWSSKIRPI
jgi:hypothetical protein